MKKFSGGVLFSALSLLLLLSFFLLLFLEDYKIKGEFQIKLANYYVALSLKEWVEEKYLSGIQKEIFYFDEGNVRLRRAGLNMQYVVSLKGQEYFFNGLMYQEDSTEELIEQIISDSSIQSSSEGSAELVENFTEISTDETTFWSSTENSK